MPPAVSEDDSDVDVPDAIPARKPEVDPLGADNDEEEEDDPEDADEFIVEAILAHKKQRNLIVYQVKWLGYDDEQDLTWEPVENLANAKVALEKYHKKIGEVPGDGSASGKKKAKAAKRGSEAVESPMPSKKQKGGRKSDANGDIGDFKPPVGTWDNDVQSVAAIIEEEEEAFGGFKKGQKDVKSLSGLLEWNNGRKTQHKMSVLRTKCPQRLLDYYESHLVFKGDPRYMEGQS